MIQWWWRLGGAAKARLVGLGREPVSREYVSGAPSPQHALDLFAGEWSSRLPGRFAALRAGEIPLFEDQRLEWAIQAIGGVAGLRVLELGPLEGGHTWMLRDRGAEWVTGIEANRRAYLKCLVVKEVLGLERTTFLLGDFLDYLRTSSEARFDLGVASGVLYHMSDPVELIALLSKVCSTLYLWTHYYDAAAIRRRPKIAARFSSPEAREHEGFVHEVHPHSYRAARFGKGFCGSGSVSSSWMTRGAIEAALRHFGFTELRAAFDEPGHPNGPSLAILARRAP
jgi:SAM-dependent methyltransferase